MIILVDQDNVLADFELGFYVNWKDGYPDEIAISTESRTTFKVEDQYPSELKSKVIGIFHKPGFYKRLPPIPGAKEALEEMARMGNEVYICSSPLSSYKNCLLEKYEWIDLYLGIEWTKKTIMTRDKTLIIGDYLIDDNPSIKGAATPQWEHVIFDRPYNRSTLNKKRINWTDWRALIK